MVSPLDDQLAFGLSPKNQEEACDVFSSRANSDTLTTIGIKILKELFAKRTPANSDMDLSAFGRIDLFYNVNRLRQEGVGKRETTKR